MDTKEQERVEKLKEAVGIICEMTGVDAAKETAITSMVSAAYALGVQSAKSE